MEKSGSDESVAQGELNSANPKFTTRFLLFSIWPINWDVISIFKFVSDSLDVNGFLIFILNCSSQSSIC